MIRPRVLRLMSALTIVTVPIVEAQPALDRQIGPDTSGHPIVVTHIQARLVGALARAAGVPMGIELAPGTPRKVSPRRLTGLTVREADDVLAAVDPRYEWREMDGVIVIGLGTRRLSLHAYLQCHGRRRLGDRRSVTRPCASIGRPTVRAWDNSRTPGS